MSYLVYEEQYQDSQGGVFSPSDTSYGTSGLESEKMSRDYNYDNSSISSSSRSTAQSNQERYGKLLVRACAGFDTQDMKDIEPKSASTMADVCSCIKSDVWPEYKFAPQEVLVNMTPVSMTLPNNIFSKLLQCTTKTHYSLDKRISFWNRYRGVVTRVLNDLKANTSSAIKEDVMKGKCDC